MSKTWKIRLGSLSPSPELPAQRSRLLNIISDLFLSQGGVFFDLGLFGLQFKFLVEILDESFLLGGQNSDKEYLAFSFVRTNLSRNYGHSTLQITFYEFLVKVTVY